MRKMLLSFKPEVYEKIKSGKKKFEHRRNFPDEPIMAYMYVSAPVKAIKGIVLNVYTHLEAGNIKEQFFNMTGEKSLKMIKRLLFVLRSIKNYIDTLWKSMNFKKLRKFHLVL